MKVALISPPTQFQNNVEPLPSLALAILSDVLEKNGIDPVCIDCNFMPGIPTPLLIDAPPQIERQYLTRCLGLISDVGPDAIGISAWGVSLPFAFKFAQTVRREMPGVFIILGGIRYEGLAKIALECEAAIDAVVVGDGEQAVVPLLEKIVGRKNVALPPGIFYREGASVVTSGAAARLKKARWGAPAYGNFLFKPAGNYLYEGSRGCPHQCIFCSLNQEQFARKDPADLVDEMVSFQKKYPARLLSLTDNYIPIHGAWTDRFCDEIQDRLPGLRWQCCSRAENISPKTAGKMARAGCVNIFLGVESISPDTLAYINKTTSPSTYCDGLLEKIAGIAEEGIHVVASTIVGFPQEGLCDMEKTTQFVIRLIERGVAGFIGVPMVYPGSRLWDQYREGTIDIVPVKNRRIFRNYGGLFAGEYEHSPWFVPNHFMPRHAFLPQEEIEDQIDAWMTDVNTARATNSRKCRNN